MGHDMLTCALRKEVSRIRRVEYYLQARNPAVDDFPHVRARDRNWTIVGTRLPPQGA